VKARRKNDTNEQTKKKCIDVRTGLLRNWKGKKRGEHARDRKRDN
jgi:hypothetical protein